VARVGLRGDGTEVRYLIGVGGVTEVVAVPGPKPATEDAQARSTLAAGIKLQGDVKRRARRTRPGTLALG